MAKQLSRTAAVHQVCITAKLYGEQNPTVVDAKASKAVVFLGCRAALVQAASTGL